MRKLFILLWCMMLLPFTMNRVDAAGDPEVGYDGSSHRFEVSHTDGLDFFDGFKNVLPGDTKSQLIQLRYQNVSQDLTVYLKANCDDQEMMELLKDATLDIYVDDQLVSEDQWIFDDVFIARVEKPLSQEMRVDFHVPTSLGNEIAGKSLTLQWVLTVQEEEKKNDVQVSEPQGQGSVSNDETVSKSDLNGGDDGNHVSGGDMQDSQENQTSQDSEDVKESYSTILDEKIPLAGASSSWAVVNLVATILTVIVSILMFMRRQSKEEDDVKDSKIKRRIWIPVLGAVVAVVSVVLFVLTEDMTLPMSYFDDYTLWMIILFVFDLMLYVFSKSWKQNNDD